ncbi:MAG: hypothetical protein CMJ18_25170 [Phycisphaeraceae bacterium]|nr:hypothetical protein [Phycisphaeraceae bacterium]
MKLTGRDPPDPLAVSIMDTSLSPIPARRFRFAEARPLLGRAGFGGTPAQISALQKMGPERAVRLFIDAATSDDPDGTGDVEAVVDPDIIAPLSRDQRRQRQRARREGDEAVIAKFRAQRQRRRTADRDQMQQLRTWWMSRLIATARPLREKLVLLWHSHFASNFRTVRDSNLMYLQNATFRRHACGNFGNLALEIVRDPAMIRFLNNNANRKRKPNENLARELMELFTLGEGHYSERDIKQGARALTGYTTYDNDFNFNARIHDEGEKTILGRTGDFDGDDFVRIILGRKQCARFVCTKLYRQFVADDETIDRPAELVIERMARLLAEQRYEMAPVLRKLFLSRHFYDRAIMGARIKSPVQLVSGTIRALRTPVRDVSLLVDAAASMGQHLFDPPSVAGWPGGRSWINTSTLFVRQNLTTYLITGKLPYEHDWKRSEMNYDPMFLLNGMERPAPEPVVDHLLSSLLSVQIATDRRRQLIEFASAGDGRITADRLVGLLALITSMPEYQLC